MPGAGPFGFLQNFSTGELVVVGIVALVVLGPERLPEMARSMGKMLHKLRVMSEGLREEMRDVLDDPSMEPIKELGELAARPREKLAAYAAEAQEEEQRRAHAAAESAAAAAAAADTEGDDPAEDVGAAVPADDAAEEPTDVPDPGPAA